MISDQSLLLSTTVLNDTRSYKHMHAYIHGHTHIHMRFTLTHIASYACVSMYVYMCIRMCMYTVIW